MTILNEQPPSPDQVIQLLQDLVAPDNLTCDVAPLHIRAGALFARLKALNRAANTAARTHKQQTADARHEMDQTYLGLQNLQYEKRHLEMEIDKCRQFASIYQDIPLYPPHEFLERAPEELQTEAILNNEHALMLARLNFEFLERQRLDQKRKQLLQAKEDLLKQSKNATSTFDNVKSQIDTLMKTANDVQRKVTDLVDSAQPSLPMT